jgi:uncharacterized membrane protein
VVPKLTWERYVDIAMDDLRQYAVSSIQVTRRLVAMLEDLAEVAPVERQPPLDRQLELLRNMATLAFSEQYDREFALRPEVRESDSDRLLQPLSR